MTKIVFKKAEILKSVRPIVIQAFDLQSTLPPLENNEDENYFNTPHTPAPPTLNTQDTVTKVILDAELIEENKEKMKAMKDQAESQAQEILFNAHTQKETLLAEAIAEKDSIIQKAHTEAQSINDDAQKETTKIKEDAKEEGLKEGLKESYKKGEEENKRLITLLQKISVEMVEEKSTILSTIEADVVDLILLIAGKVVKSITSQYKQVVYDNVVAAIHKLKVKNELVIRVNPEDLYTVETHKSNILAEINGIENIQFLEDPTIDIGGCVIKSNFGSVDARIASQMAEIEEQIRKVSPIKPL